MVADQQPVSPRSAISRQVGPELPTALRENVSDHAAKLLRATLGNLPVGGALITELIGYIIPNQREERLCAYLTRLADRVEAMGQSLDSLLTGMNPETAALFEDGASGAVRSTSDDRIQHLVDLVAEGMGAGGRAAEDQRVLVRMLNDLTEVELRYLMSWTKKYNSDADWRRKHGFDFRFEQREGELKVGEKTVKITESVPVGDTMDSIVEMAIQGRLQTLGLFERRVIQARDGMGSRRGDQFEYDVNLSEEGLALLRRLGLIELGDERAYAWEK